jgi:hypothetical protein
MGRPDERRFGGGCGECRLRRKWSLSRIPFSSTRYDEMQSISVTRRSKYYIAEKSWTKRPACAFEVPLDTVRGGGGVVGLRYETGPTTGEYREFNVPCTFLLENLSGLWIREDRQTISLFLSAEPHDLFTDKRGAGGVSFKKLAV